MRKNFKNNILQVDKKRKRDDESDVSEGFDYAELARRAAQATVNPCDTGIFSLEAKSDQTNLQTGKANTSNFSTQATSSSDAIVDTTVDSDK